MKRKEEEESYKKNDGKGKSPRTKDNKSDMIRGNGSTVKRSIVLMKQKLCSKIIAKSRIRRDNLVHGKKGNKAGPAV